jgi:hypothetical protein
MKLGNIAKSPVKTFFGKMYGTKYTSGTGSPGITPNSFHPFPCPLEIDEKLF